MKRNRYISIFLLIILLSGSMYLALAQTTTIGQVPAQQETTTEDDNDEPNEATGSSGENEVRAKQYKHDEYTDLQRTASPFDLKDPDNIRTAIEYEPETGYYIMHTRVGDTEIATPFMMTEEEYRNYSGQQAIQQYWKEKQNTGEPNNEAKFDLTDIKFNIGPADKIFGPGGVQLKTQGSAEMKFALNHTQLDNPALTQRARNNTVLDFDTKIQLSVNGKVGDKVNFNMNYNTEATFDQDQQMLKLNYKGKEDDIIQTLEAGNVSMQLNSSLITGSSSLFGIRTDLKFGKLSVQAIASQQNSESQTVSSEGGAQMTEFEISIDNYDENRHFFLAHYFRDNFDKSMSSLPHITSGITINRIEVWVTNKRGNFDQARNIVAFMDLGETQHLDNSHWVAQGGLAIPYNKSNNLYDEVIALPNVRDIQYTNSVLDDAYGSLGIIGGEDYEKIESARLLTSSEYTLNSELGFISLRSALNADEVLAVAFEYTYGGKVYQVGEFSTDAVEAPNALVLKLLKGTSQSPGLGTWDLMMKNVYSLGAMQMQQEDFELFVAYKNDSVGTELQYISEGNIKNKNLLRVMNLDRLDSRNNPNPDGKFDYVEGYTAISSTGRIIFPVLEPFGSHLRKAIGNDAIADKYVYQELYDSTLVIAQEYSEKNKFILKGEYKGSSGSEIRLNAMNIPRGSVVVTAGGATLVENVDYTVDYMMGTVTILNQSILDSGTNIDVRLENQSTFSMQRKSLFGTHLEYAFTKDLSVGATVMHMSELPLTTKVNTGSEPLANTIWGMNAAWKTESQWLTNMIDKLPWTTATQPSTFAINAEFAQLVPGHSKTISEAGLAYIDDFESTKTNIDIHYPYYWCLASTPYNPNGGLFPEAALSNNTDYGKNRALLAWYTVDQILVIPQRNTPDHLSNDADARSDHRVRTVAEQEIFPNRETLANETSRLSVLNLSYYPTERGPYNVDVEGMNPDGTLANPKQRWGGMMRKLDVTDFENSNIEYVEFWMMDPFLTNSGEGYSGGDLYLNLGDVSEDILKDGKKSFEHGLPIDGSDKDTETTVWGRVPKTQSTVRAFDNTSGAREHQDVGLNGLSTEQEFLFPTYKDYVDALRAKLTPDAIEKMEADPFSPLNDPAGDNYHYYRGTDYDEQEKSILDRYKYYNGTEGNSPATENSTESYGTAATLSPDIEDINNDNTVNEYEKYYQYRIRITPDAMQVGTNYITDMITSEVELANGKTEQVRWYQFKVPIREYTEKVGSIRNFKSIRFIRLFLTGFEEETHLRLGTMDLVRGEWRSYTKALYDPQNPPISNGTLDVQAVNYEENSTKTPVNYVLPPGVSRQTDPGQMQIIQQNEQAMVLRVNNLAPGDARAVYKNTGYDMRMYKRLQLFVHAEKMVDDTRDLEDYELTCFIRLGSDMVNNYYEYEIPLKLTEPGTYQNDKTEDRQAVWLPENMFDFAFDKLTDAKLQRNKAKRNGTANVSNSTPYTIYDEEKSKNKITVVGNPTLEEVENIMIGIRNAGEEIRSGEIWVNELRMSEFDEEGGWAALANMSLGLSDIGQVNVSGRFESAGFGSIESNMLNRRMEDQFQISVSAALEAGRLFPEKAKLQIPLYYAYTNETLSPKYNPLDTDIELSDALDMLETKEEKDSLKAMSQTVATSHNFSLTGAKVNIKSKKKPMFYDPANFSISYSYNKQMEHDAEIEQNVNKEHRGSLNYSYNFNPQPWEPFKNVKALNKKAYKLIKEFNIYYLPQSWSFSTDMYRTFSQMSLRNFNTADTGSEPMDLTFSKEFMWNRQFDIKYDFSRTLKFSLQTAMNSNIEEAYFTPEIGKEYYEAWRDTVMASIAKLGTPYTYQQVFTASWNVPINKIPFLDWITANGSYNATYSWNRTAQMEGGVDLGNMVSSLASWQVDGQMNFENLYNKSKYLKSINQRYGGRTRPVKRKFQSKDYSQTVNCEAKEPMRINHRLNAAKIAVTVTDKTGKEIKVKYKSTNNSTIELTSPVKLDSALLTIVTIDPNARSIGQQIGEMSLRFLMMIRRVSATYRVTNSLVVPGFYPEAGFMGQRGMGGGLYAPGYDFAFGFIDDQFMEKASSRGWLSMNDSIVQPATAAYTSDFDVKINLEPLPGLKIDLNGKRYEANTTSIQYMYEGMPETFTGSYNITQVALATAFSSIGNAKNNYTSKNYERFLSYRDIMADRLQQKYDAIGNYPTTGFLSPDNNSLSGKPYDRKNGTVDKGSGDVMIPAFLAAYTGRDINKVNTNPFLGILSILPNWRVSYDGLSRIPWVKENFKSVSLTHAYTCKYSIGSYTSFSTWVSANNSDNSLGFIRDVQTENPLPSSAYDISSVSLTEQFSPLIGLNMTMKNSITAKAEYRKQRNLALNVSSAQMVEGATDEFVIGLGYTIKEFDLILKLKSNKQKKVKNDLKVSADVSYKDVKSILRKIEENIAQASSGNKVWSIKVMADYVLSSKINLQFFYDRQSTIPLISSSFPVSTDNFGVNIKLMLTR